MQKKHDLEVERLQQSRRELNKDIIKRLDFIHKSLSEKMKQKHT